MREWLAGVVGENLAPVVSVILAAAVVILLALVLIGLAKRVFSGTGGIGSRSRAPRLAVLDVTAIDPKRKLVLVRRDEVEHLLLIGGQNDLVVEPTILRGQVPRRPRVEGAAPRREPELARDTPVDRVAPPVPPRRVPVASAPDTLPPVVDLPAGEPASPNPREIPPRSRVAARVEPPVDAPAAPRVESVSRSPELTGLFSTSPTPERDEDEFQAPKPRRDGLPSPETAVRPSTADVVASKADQDRRGAPDSQPAWMMTTSEREERSPPTQDAPTRVTHRPLTTEDRGHLASEREEPASAIFASVVPPAPARPIVQPPVETPTRSEASHPGASVDRPLSAPAGTAVPTPPAPRSMATPTLPVPVRAPTLPLPPLQRTEPSPAVPPPAPSRSLWSPTAAPTAPSRGPTPDPASVERDRATPDMSQQTSPAPAASGDPAKPAAVASSNVRLDDTRVPPATTRSGPAPFPAAPAPAQNDPAADTRSSAAVPAATAPLVEPDDGRQPLSVRSFATTIQARRTVAPQPAEPRSTPSTPMAPPVLSPLAPPAPVDTQVGNEEPTRSHPTPISEPKRSAEVPDESGSASADVARPLTLEEEMERLLHDFTIDVSDRR